MKEDIVIYAVIGEDMLTGLTGIVATTMGGVPIPLICFEQKNVDALITIAQRTTHKNRRIIKFTPEEILWQDVNPPHSLN